MRISIGRRSTSKGQLSVVGRGIAILLTASAGALVVAQLPANAQLGIQIVWLGAACIYIGLIDPWDGVTGALERIEVARRHLPSFGLATACGWGRRPPNETP